MERDNLEKFILENREAFDNAYPNLKVWAEIDKTLEQKSAKKVNLRRILSIAASVVVLLVAGGLVGSYLSQPKAEDLQAMLENISPEYSEIEQHYSRQINQKYQQLVSNDNAGVVKDDFAQIDKVMQELKQELLDAPKGKEEQIIQNLIISYQTKIEILERVLERIQSTNQKPLKSEDDEISI